MANLDKSNILNGGTIESSHLTDLYDALTGTTTYDNISLAGSSSYALTASYAENAGGGAVDTGSLLITSSISDATLTFTKGDTSTFNLTVNNVNNATSSSYALTASYVTTAQTASYVTTAQTASYINGSNVSGAVGLSNSVNSLISDNNAPALSNSLSLAGGSVRLESGIGTVSSLPGILAGKVLGRNCFITVTAISSGTSGAFMVAFAGEGIIRITEIGGTSNGTVNYIVMYLPG